jgi:hypothetical protein
VIAPTGEQIEIAAGDQQAVVVEVGGGLRSYSAGGRALGQRTLRSCRARSRKRCRRSASLIAPFRQRSS